MVGRHVNAATGAAYAPERLKPGGDHLLSRQRRRAVSTPERRRQEARERQALQGMGQSESAAFSERLDFRAAKQGQARLSTPFVQSDSPMPIIARSRSYSIPILRGQKGAPFTVGVHIDQLPQ